MVVCTGEAHTGDSVLELCPRSRELVVSICLRTVTLCLSARTVIVWG